jgi:hypothetical protein
MTDKEILTSFMEDIITVPKKYQGGAGIGIGIGIGIGTCIGTGTRTGTGIRKKPARVSYKKQLMELLAHEEIKAIKSYDEICTRYKKVNGPIPVSVPVPVPVPMLAKKPKKNDATLEHAIKFMHNGAKFIIYNKKIYDETGKYLFPDITHLSVVVPKTNIVSGIGIGIGITKFMDKELGEFIKMDSILYSQIHDKYAILTGEIVDDNICIYQGYTDS